jgi:tRNA(Met) C34 N-acetyltransferase TmcA
VDKTGDPVMDILVDSPSRENLARLEKEAEKSLGEPGMEVRVRQEVLYSVNEEV